jgi:hypothetical protein
MTNIGKDLSRLSAELNAALELVSDFSGALPIESSEVEYGLALEDTHSLLERCRSVTSTVKEKRKLRAIHHFACSGGTLISKCISSLPNVFLMSELQPTSLLHLRDGHPKFSPSDVITQARYAHIPNINELAWKVFVNSIEISNEHVQSLGGHLVIRAHTHSEFCVGSEIPKSSPTIEHLKSKFDLINILTVRNPIDSYLSLIENGWVHFEPASFDDYCNRLLECLNQFEDSQVFKYEDIVSSPERSLREIARTLALPFSESFIDTFSAFKVTGDSGRTSDIISTRERKQLSKDFENEVLSSNAFKKISTLLDYEL